MKSFADKNKKNSTNKFFKKNPFFFIIMQNNKENGRKQKIHNRLSTFNAFVNLFLIFLQRLF